MPTEPLKATVCIVGGGPAGIVLALLLARQGIDVTVLEKHKDFNRDFRGDTIHAATLRVMDELGLLEPLLKLPHQRLEHAEASLGGQTYPVADFTTLPKPANFVALMPQWDLLDFLSTEVSKYPNARILMEHKVTSLLQAPGPTQPHPRTLGVVAETPSGPLEIRAALTVGCDGRHAITTDAAHLDRIGHGVPIDVLWFRLSRRATDPETALGNLNFGRFIILINRGDYFQCGYIIRKDTFVSKIQPAGLPTFRADIASIVPFLAEPAPSSLPGQAPVAADTFPAPDSGPRVTYPIASSGSGCRLDELQSWDQVSALSIQVNRLRRWHLPGLLCIGDAAHAMSPVGGIGINLAIQDAVAAARILTPGLLTAQRRGTPVTELALAHVQHRRQLPTRLTQRVQVIMHGFLDQYLGNPAPLKAPLLLRVLSRSRLFRRTSARFIALGLRPEHIR